MVQLFNFGKIALWVVNLFNCQYHLTFFALAGLWKPENSYELGFQSILLFIQMNFLSSLLCSEIIPCVDDEIIFALNLWTKFELIVSKNLIQLHMEPHELCKRLLSEESLCLQVHLRNRFAWKTARPKNIMRWYNLLLNLFPLANTKLL